MVKSYYEHELSIASLQSLKSEMFKSEGKKIYVQKGEKITNEYK